MSRNYWKTSRPFSWLLPLCIFLVALIPRIYALDRIPTGISNDELDYILNAKAIINTGSGLTGSYSPIRITDSFPNAELSSVLIAPLIGKLTFNLATARIPFAFLGAVTVVLLYLVTRILIENRSAFMVAVVATCNPWNIFFSRTTYDAPVTTLFLLLGLYALLQKKRIIRISAIIPFVVAFYVYMGMMVVVPIFIVGSLVFVYFYRKKKNLTELLCIGFVCVLCIARYGFLLPHIPGGVRVSEIATPNDHLYTQMTNEARRVSIESPVTNLFANKMVAFGKTVLSKYAGAFSPHLLFIYGDARRIFSFSDHGLFYPIDTVFLVIGVLALASGNTLVFAFLSFVAIIAPLPSVISNEGITYASRSYLLQMPFIIFIGVGLSRVIVFFERRKQRSIFAFVMVCISVMFVVSCANFIYTYMLKNPMANSESYNFSSRLMARYAMLESGKNQKVVVVSGEPKTSFKQYIFYTNTFRNSNSSVIKDLYRRSDFRIDTFSSIKCPDEKFLIDEQTTVIVEGNPTCKGIDTDVPHLTIPILADAGQVYGIYGGKTCGDTVLERYPHDIRYEDLEVERLSEERFCEKFIIRY